MSAVTIPSWRHVRLSNIILLICWVSYVVLTVATPIRRNPYHISHAAALLIDLTIFILVGIIWYVAMRGATSFKNYANIVHGAKEAPGLNAIANGLIWAATYLVVISVTGAVVQYFATSNFSDTLAILRDHLTVLVVLVAFIYLYVGSQRLAYIAKFDTWDRKTMLIIAVYMLFAIAFVIAFTHATVPPPGSSRNSLSILPHNILLFSLILPYLIAWFLGILACVNISRYAIRSRGILYRQALVNLVRGIITVIAFGIILQLLTFSVRFLTSLSLSSILAIIYAIIILYGLGFLFIRSGAKMLSRIEVVK